MTVVAGIDCGTNSIRLLVADVHDGRLTDRHREMRIVRLGQDVDRTGRLAAAALERTGAALRDYAAVVRESGAGRVRLVATSAIRDAVNRAEFAQLVRRELGIEPDVVTGAEEARLSFAGAASVLPRRGDLLVADIGGGSTELVRGSVDGELSAHSMDVGSVRMTERHLADDPPTARQLEAVRADVRTRLHAAEHDVSFAPGAQLVGVAGTVTTVAALALGLDRYDSAAIDGARITAAQVRDVTARLVPMTREQRAASPVIHPGRVDVIVAGAVILETIVDVLRAPDLVASEHDILDGIALSLA